MKIETIEKAKFILNQSKEENLSMLCLIDNNLCDTLEIFGDSVVIRRENMQKSVYLYSPNEKSFKEKVLPKIKKEDKSFSSIKEWMSDILTENSEIERLTRGTKLALPNKAKINVPKNKVRTLNMEDAEKVNNFWDYKHEQSLNYIKHLIKDRLCEGIEINNELVAWAVTHDDGSLGIMHVLEKHRRQGFAKDITYSMSIKTRASNKIPFLHVVENNEKSLNLTKKMGFEIVSHVVWLRLK